MPTLSAQIDREDAAVILTVDDRKDVQALIRTDANGTRAVRMPANLGGRLPGIGSGVFVDHEVALGGRVSYRLVHPDFKDLVWVNMSGDWAPRFTLPAQPLVRATAEVVTEYDAERKTGATFHEVIGRSDPLVVEGILGSRSGSLKAEFDTLAASASLEAVLRRGKTVMYRQSEQPGMDMYFHVESLRTTVDPEHGVWSVEVAFVEVSYPAGTMVSDGSWTFATLTGAHATFTDVSLAYESYQDLALGLTQ